MQIMSTHRLDVTGFTTRQPRGVTLGCMWRRTGQDGPSTTFGLNLHRRGGISLTGVPAQGGSTVCWGRLRERLDGLDGQHFAQTGELLSARTWVRCFGPFMVRVGRDF